MSIRIVTRPTSTPQALDPTATAAQLGAVGSEAAVGEVIAAVTRLVETEADLFLWYRGYQEVQEADGTDRLYLSARPLVAVSDVHFDDEDPLDEGTESDEFALWRDQGYLYRRDCWVDGAPGWDVTFTAGWWLWSMEDDDPGGIPTDAVLLDEDRPDVKRAIFQAVKVAWELDQVDGTVRREKMRNLEIEYRGGLQSAGGYTVPQASLDVFRTLRRIVV